MRITEENVFNFHGGGEIVQILMILKQSEFSLSET